VDGTGQAAHRGHGRSPASGVRLLIVGLIRRLGWAVPLSSQLADSMARSSRARTATIEENKRCARYLLAEQSVTIPATEQYGRVTRGLARRS
jgi:hypothetical protein